MMDKKEAIRQLDQLSQSHYMASYRSLLREIRQALESDIQPAPAEQGEGRPDWMYGPSPCPACGQRDTAPGYVCPHCGRPYLDHPRALDDALARALTSRPQPEATKVVPKQMLREITNIWHAYGWMPQQISEIVAKYMPGYMVRE